MASLLRAGAPFVAIVTLVSCSSRETPPAPVAQPSITSAPATGAPVFERLQRFAMVKESLARRIPIELRGEGYVRSHVARQSGLATAILPRTIDAPMHLVPRGNEDAWIDVRSLDVDSKAGALHENAIVFEDVAPSTDAVMTAESVRVEETRILRDEKAPTTFRYRIDLGPGIVDAHVRSGMVELADATGYTHLSTDVAYAVDAKGVKRELTIALEGSGSTRTMVATLDARGLEYPIAVDPVWTNAPNQPGGPGSNVAIALDSGKVFVIGGYSPYTCLYNPATNTWEGGTLSGSTIPNVPIDFRQASGTVNVFLRATKLASGKVLVLAGGTTDRRVALFDETTKTYSVPAAQQVNVCNNCEVVTLPSGNAFKAVPNGAGWTELYNATSGTWSSQAAHPIVSGSEIHLAALKSTYAGRVFAFGGSPAQSAALYNSATNTWTSYFGRRFNTPRVIPLADGRAMVAGGPSGSGSPPAVAIIFDPATGTFKDTSISPVATPGVGIALLSSGLVLAAGGETGFGTSTVNTLSTSAIYDPKADTWTTIDALATSQAEAEMVETTTKKVFLGGGIQNYGGPTTQAQVYTPLAQGTSCGTGSLKGVTCSTGYCVDNTCCTTASCPSGVCNAPAVKGRAAGVCALNNGQACSASSQCASNFCVDGVCCNAACTGQCEACNGAGTAGTCAPVTGAPKAPRAACGGVGAGTACGATCDGTNRTSCTFAPAGTVACGSASCTGGTMTTPSKCDGKGACPSTSSSCGAYACGPSACLTTCSNDSFCAAGYFCDLPSSTCVPKIGLGVPCATSSTCSAGTFCTDGVCCGVASCGTGSSCALGTAGGPILPGTCSKTNGTKCSNDSECGSQHCVDGVCCNTTCTDQCAACDVPSKEGTCSPVLGKPHGTTRAACDDGGTNKCAAKQCDGTSATSACNGFVNDGTVTCAPASCSGPSTLTPASVCDGAGACAPSTASSCGKYTCDSTTLACRTSCTSNSDCANEATCKSGVCTDAPTCSDDFTQSIDPVTKVPTDCAPYKCASTGACGTSCATSTDCAAGDVCDTASGTGVCVAPSGDSGDSGGCVYTGSSPSAPWSSLALGALAVAAVLARGRRVR